jgi:membrane protease YdiL (CAAX protease family)
MTLLTVLYVLIALAVLGLFLYFVNTRIPMPAWIKLAINIIAAIAVFLAIMHFFGLWDYLGSIRIGGHHHR